MKKAHVIAFATLALIIIGITYLQILPSKKGSNILEAKAPSEIPEGAHVVTLTKDGFTPGELTIKKGETVAFVSTNGKLFWPASNLHPSHALYPEFDPKLPIQADEAWSFTFMNVGEWKYHDHLAPYYTGVITVTE